MEEMLNQDQEPQEEAESQEQPAEQFGESQEQPAEQFGESQEQPAEQFGEVQEGEFRDKVVKCSDCSAEFVHTAAAQAFYKEKGFANDPKRCPACRRARKASAGYGARGGAARQMYPAVCAACGKETQVPFKPSGARPVYCRDCYLKQQGR